MQEEQKDRQGEGDGEEIEGGELARGGGEKPRDVFSMFYQILAKTDVRLCYCATICLSNN